MKTDYIPMNETLRELIKAECREQRIGHDVIAKAVGLKAPWVSKLLNGGIQTIHLTNLEAIQNVLGVSLMVSRDPLPMSGLAEQFAALIDSNELVAMIAKNIIALMEAPGARSLPWIDTKDLVRIGGQIERLVHAEPGKPGLIGREVMAMLNNPKKRIPLGKPWPKPKRKAGE